MISRSRQSVPLSLSSVNFHFFSRSTDDEQEQARMRALPSVRTYHSSASMLYNSTPPSERSAVAITMGLGAVSAGAYAASTLVSAYKEWQASRPEPTEEDKKASEDAKNNSKADDAKQGDTQKEEKKKEGPRENIFAKWFEVGGKYYEGGFEDSMTRREAALILGVRESSSAQRIKDNHRKLLILNHPDTGGSTYIAGKINEAKELLLKGKSK